MRTAIYIRVSTDEQAKEGFSLAAQQDKLEAFCYSQGWEIKKVYIEEGYSAKNINRPQLKQMLSELDQFDVVLVYKLDRLSRSVADINELLQTFESHSVSFKSATEPYDTTTAQGKLLINIFGSLAQFEREQLAERVQMGMMKKATLGERNGGRAPFGYKLNDGKLIVNDEEARFVKEMFRLYINGKGIRSIVLYLQQLGIDKDIRTVGRMLENPVYTGTLRWANNSKLNSVHFEETHEAIISKEVFEQVQTLRKTRGIEGKKATSPYPFSGVLRCARCGSSLSGYYKKARGTKHYICIAKKNKGTCDLPMFTEHALEEVFLSELSPDNSERFLKLVKDFEVNQPELLEAEQMIHDLEKEISAIKIRKKNWLLALGNGVISQDEFLDMTEDDAKNEAILKEQLEQYSSVNIPLDKDAILTVLSNIPELWVTASDIEKKNFMNELFEEIVVNVPSTYYRGRGKTPSVLIEDVVLK